MAKSNSPSAADAASAQQQRLATERRRDANLARIGRVVAVMSGKGGVGKSTVAASLALALARLGRRTGLLDVDFHGPSVPILLGLGGAHPTSTGHEIEPIEVEANLRVMSLGLLLEAGDEAVIWRGPMKIHVINQLLGDVAWGDLDFLVFDCPPGTGDEPLSLGQTIPTAEVIMVGTPQEVAMADVRKAVAFCRKLHLRVIGLVETMGTMRCPACGEETPLFRSRDAARPKDIPLLARIPFDPALHAACDEGRLTGFLAGEGPTADTLTELAHHIVASGPESHEANQQNQNAEGGQSLMRYAIPTADGRLTMHFGHVEAFALVDVEDGTVTGVRSATPPSHAPGALPAWLKQNDVGIVIVGGMGQRAQGLLTQSGIQVILGAPTQEPEELVRQHLAGTLTIGENICDH